MARVEFKNVTKSYSHESTNSDNQTGAAVNGLSFVIEDGEMVVLVGPSGCGKSTSLRLLAGLESVSEGEILIDDVCVNQATPQQRNVAMVFQNYALYPHMSVRRNLEFPLKMAQVPLSERQQKIAEIAAILNLTELLERKPQQLSGGQRQRVAMGRALVRDPSVFLLDEPLSNLDAKLRTQIRADIAQLQKRLHKTTLYVTHDQVEAMTLGDRVAVMNTGELQQFDTPERLYMRPCNMFVARFIGNPGMNIVPARLLLDNESLFIDIAGQRIPYVQSGEPNRQLTQYVGQPLFAGFRPEALCLENCENCIKLAIEIVTLEFLGHETLLHFHLPQTDTHNGSDTFVARLSGDVGELSPGTGDIYLDPASLYWFDERGHCIFPT